MKTDKEETTQSTIAQLREIRDKISLDIMNMTFEQLRSYVRERMKLHPTADWQKMKKVAK